VVRTGMIKGGFRGSDDACVYNFNIPENAFAAVALRQVAPVLSAVGQSGLASTALSIASEVETGIAKYGTMVHPTAGRVYAYEVDGFGNALFMDDANIPSLLAMPYYGWSNASDPLYIATRAAVLSPANPWWMNGTAASGVGGPHNGYYWIWPMSLMAQAWTSTSDAEIGSLLATLVDASACSGLVHESFDRNDFGSYTRPWFAWANSLFGALVMKIAAERPYLIFN
jgi:meiotically up-regulated gene 157 (Mug157) protein